MTIVALLTGLVVLVSFDFQLFWKESHMYKEPEKPVPTTDRVLCTRCNGTGNEPHILSFLWKRICSECGGTGHLVSRNRTRAVMTLEKALGFFEQKPKGPPQEE